MSEREMPTPSNTLNLHLINSFRHPGCELPRDAEKSVSNGLKRKSTETLDIRDARQRGELRWTEPITVQKWIDESGTYIPGQDGISKGTNTRLPPPTLIGRTKYRCLHCHREDFRDKSKLDDHLYSHNNHRAHACDIDQCSKRYKYLRDLRKHKRSAHDSTPALTTFDARTLPPCRSEQSAQVPQGDDNDSVLHTPPIQVLLSHMNDRFMGEESVVLANDGEMEILQDTAAAMVQQRRRPRLQESISTVETVGLQDSEEIWPEVPITCDDKECNYGQSPKPHTDGVGSFSWLPPEEWLSVYLGQIPNGPTDASGDIDEDSGRWEGSQ